MDSMGNGFQVDAGPTHIKASGNIAVNVLLAILVVGASFFGIWTTTQQTIILTQQHDAMINSLSENATVITSLTRANENVFLSTMLPNDRKKELPSYIQDRAREIVEKRAEVITNERTR